MPSFFDAEYFNRATLGIAMVCFTLFGLAPLVLWQPLVLSRFEAQEVPTTTSEREPDKMCHGSLCVREEIREKSRQASALTRSAYHGSVFLVAAVCVVPASLVAGIMGGLMGAGLHIVWKRREDALPSS